MVPQVQQAKMDYVVKLENKECVAKLVRMVQLVLKARMVPRV
jgi:hypothetical protein